MTQKLSKEELDKQFELFLKESVSDDSVDLGILENPSGGRSKSPKLAPKPTVSWLEDDLDKGTVGSGKSFLKSLRKTPTIQEEEKDSSDKSPSQKVQNEDRSESRGLSSALGLDTLEEQLEKEQFFADLEAGASSTIDFAKLNRELGSTSSTYEPGLGIFEGTLDRAGQNKDSPRGSADSPHYSDDFEAEDEKEQKQTPKMSPILAKVSLLDSLDDTREEPKKSTTDSMDKAQSGGSELEALTRLLQMHALQDSEGLDPILGSRDQDLGVDRDRDHDRDQSPALPGSAPLHRASTLESDLPTAEELMKPIRPEDDSLTSFRLHPLSSDTKDRLQLSEDAPLKRPALSGWTVDLLPDPDLDPAPVLDIPLAPPVLPDPPPPPPPLVPDPVRPVAPERVWSVAEELERLMQDQEKPAPASRTSRAKKVSLSSGSSVNRTFQARTRDTRTTAVSRPLPTALGPASRPASGLPTGPERSQPDAGVESRDLVASVQSLVSVLQQQVTSKHTEPEPQLSPLRQSEETSALEALKFQLLQKEKLIEKLKLDSEEVQSLKQHNYLLQSKLRSAEESLQKNKLTDASDSKHQEKLQTIEKEMKEQETLIQGYQQENERLYQQMKVLQAQSKANEEVMFEENQRLLNQLSSTREQLEKAQRPVSTLCSMDHSQRISQLLAQLHTLQKSDLRLREEIQRLNQEKQAAEQQHQEEVSELKRRLKWFAENQQLLDRDASRLRAATAETLQLKEQVEKLKVEVGKREQQKKSRERSADGRKIQALEKQVKELEQILRSRNPNSLPALIFAAASAPEHPEAPPQTSCSSSGPSRVSALLERRAERLEAELEARDHEAKRSIRALEQQFQAIRMRYEQQISELEQQLEQRPLEPPGADPGPGLGSDLVQRSDLITGLREELRREREAHREKETSLQKQLSDLQQQLKRKSHSSPSRHERQAEAAFGLRIERLNQELTTKSRTIQDLIRTVERLQREQRGLLSVPRGEGREGREGRRQAAMHRTAPESDAATEVFPALSDKSYQPTEFTDSHITEVQQENSALRLKLQQMQTDAEREREELRTALTQSQQQLHTLQEAHSQQLSSLQAQSLRDQAQLRSSFALEHSSSAVAQLSNQLNTQQVMVQQLQQQLSEAQSCRRELSVSRAREEALQTQLSRCLLDLKAAREAQTPEGKLLWSLEQKVTSLETRQEQRDRELQQVMAASLPVGTDLQSELQRWKRLAQNKTEDLQTFRLELDSILDIIRHLQRQGVLLSAPGPRPQTTQAI
uniref:Centrosomal protein of 162 kDa n=1 Tax=Knipowitschia caucasica TaxID=637954 RepID=A0AAV2MFN8_KNICA